jgi:hypothetical protein
MTWKKGRTIRSTMIWRSELRGPMVLDQKSHLLELSGFVQGLVRLAGNPLTLRSGRRDEPRTQRKSEVQSSAATSFSIVAASL